MNKKRLKVILEKIEMILMTIAVMVFILGIIFLVSGWTMDIRDLLYEGRNFMLLSSICFFTSIALAVVNGFVKIPENSQGKLADPENKQLVDKEIAIDCMKYIDQLEHNNN